MKKIALKIKPEAMKSGLNVIVDWYGDTRTFYPGKLIKKLRKNWGVELNRYGEICEASIPYEAMYSPDIDAKSTVIGELSTGGANV